MSPPPSSVLHPPMISVIVPAYNRADEVEKFLYSFEKQSAKNFEIIIVDDGSTDNTKTVVETHKYKLDLKYFFHQNEGPGAARNLGMENAKGDILVFIDSDCTVPEDYINNLTHHLENENFDAFGGPDTCHENFSPFLKAINYSMTSFIGTGGTRGSKGKQLAKYYPRSFNMGIKRNVYEQIGDMNALRHGQDMEFSNRVFNAGFKVSFLSDVIVYHKRRTNLKKFFKQIFNWGVTRINLAKIDKDMLKPIHCLPTFVILIFFLTLIFSFWFHSIRYLFLFEIVLIIFVVGFAFIQSAFKYKSSIVGLLSILTLLIQVVSYGLGLLYGFIKSIFTKKGVFVTGFTKKYYK